jgi:glycosyltransferase involved in cell wall biosynthesis
MLDRRIRVMTGFVANDEVQRYLRAADILVIPRIRALNSGNAALGFTFGTVVVGPQHGVIGKTLRQTGNPTFDPRDPASPGQALEHATSLTRRGKGAQNEAHARVRWNWRVIGAQHVGAYRRA